MERMEWNGIEWSGMEWHRADTFLCCQVLHERSESSFRRYEVDGCGVGTSPG